MPRFALSRDYPSDLTRTQIDGMVLASGAALQTFIYRGSDRPSTSAHGISWVRSYWQPGGTWGVCIFDAPDLAILSAFQDLCAAPFHDAMEVEEAAANPNLATSIALQFNMRHTSDDPIAAASTAIGVAPRDVGRVYLSRERSSALAFVATEPAPTNALRIESGVVEITPDEYS